jgi:LPXTG-motif cell wall-anchored protein
VSGYCVKAGSINNGNGPVYVAVDPPQASVTFGYPGGKDISHYSATFVDIPEDTTPTVPQTAPTVPEETPTVPEETTTTAATTVVTEESTTTTAQEQLVPVPTPAPSTPDQVDSQGPVPSSAVLSASTEQLPTTGSSNTGTLLLGGGVLVTGLALVRFTRRSDAA